MDKLRALQYFTVSADEGSFTAAARKLDVSVPAIQKLVTGLERQLGVRLFERSVHGLTLTASGATYREACQPLLVELAEVDEALTRSARRPAGTLVIAAHAQLAHHLLLPALPRFHAHYPEILVDLRVINRLTDADAETADVFVLHGWPDAAHLVHRRLGHARAVIIGAPEYWATHGVPRHPRDLAAHDCMLMRNPAGILIDLWEFARGEEKTSVTVSGWLCSNGRELLLEAVLAGKGVARFNHLTTQALVQAGRLTPVLLDWEVVGGPPLNVLFRPNQRRTPRVRAFVDFVTTLLSEIEAEQTISAELPHWHRRGYGRASAVLRRR